MSNLVVLFVHVMATVARRCGPGSKLASGGYRPVPSTSILRLPLDNLNTALGMRATLRRSGGGRLGGFDYAKKQIILQYFSAGSCPQTRTGQPAKGANSPADPGSWNRYAYAERVGAPGRGILKVVKYRTDIG
jgi:hypothetical protein